MALQVIGLGTGPDTPGSDTSYQAWTKQNAMNAELYGPVILASRTASGTLQLSEAESLVEVNAASGVTITIPTAATVAFPIGTSITLRQVGAGSVTVAAAAGVTLRNPGSLVTKGQWASLLLSKRGTNEWVVEGNTTS
jgi:hypothetical protein